MDSSPSSDDQLEEELKQVGNELLAQKPVNELISLLDKLENLLSTVEQKPPQSKGDAVLSAMNALKSYELLRHSNVDVKISVTSCISEISRISAPTPPYDDELMKEIFQMTIKAFKKLPSLSGHSYCKAIHILEILATVRSCLMMLDLECNDLIIEMFHQFLSTIRLEHPPFVFSYMEAIMTMIIKESDEISVDLLNPLLYSVKNENQRASPLSWKLGEKVLNNCAATIKPYLTELLKSTSLALDDYAEIVTSICQGKPVSEEVAPAAVCPVENDQSMDGLSNLVTKNDTSQMRNEDSLENENSLMLLQRFYQIENQEDTDSRTDDQPEKQDARETLLPKTDPAIPKEMDGIQNFDMKTNQGNNDEATNLQPEKQDERDSQVPVLDPEVPKKRDNVVTEDNGISNSEGKQESLSRKIKNKKKNKGFTGESGDQVLVFPSVTKSLNRDESLPNEASKTKHKRKQTSKMEEGSGILHAIEEYGEELVGVRIKVWWPLDLKFYEGIISSFDPSKKRHKVLYDDGDEEILDLSVECFQVLGNTSPDQERPANLPSPAGLSKKALKKKAKTKSKSSTPSSKG